MPGKNLRKAALRIFRAALKAADPAEAVRRHFSAPPDTYERIFVVGAGKATAPMARAMERILGKRIAGGLINIKYGHAVKLTRIEQNECGHPIPDESGVRGAQRIAAIARDATARDLVICLISGGGSALLPLPAPNITLGEKQATTNLCWDAARPSTKSTRCANIFPPSKADNSLALAAPAHVVSLHPLATGRR